MKATTVYINDESKELLKQEQNRRASYRPRYKSIHHLINLAIKRMFKP